MTTSQLRSAWGPACAGTKVSLHEAYRYLDAAFQRWSYRPRAGVTGSYNCRRITGGTGYSLHSFGPGGIFVFWTGVRVTMALAVDVCWDRNPYGPKLITDMPRAMIDEIVGLRTNDGQQVWGWGGDYRGNRDAMHFEIVCSPASLATGIRGVATLPRPADPPPDQPVPQGVPDMHVVISGVGAYALFDGVLFRFTDWNTFLQSRAASQGVPMSVISDTEPEAARTWLADALTQQSFNTVGVDPHPDQ